ncbi:PucR family transcriptional regulator [Pseudoclavibacter sp. CFCC 14310]|nr:PucR family transcriptional regulator [Pseudoclavibacter sp. CFCC 14310]
MVVAVRRLQVHRHTLRACIEKCARVLDADLRDPKVRHELWLALQALPE